MAITRTQKINLGIFVFVSLAILFSGLVALVGSRLWEKKDTYTIRFSSKNISLSGLDIGSPVKYSGIKIGRVTSISIDPKDLSTIVVTIEVAEDTPISVDSRAALANIGITGLKYVELSRGSPGKSLRKPGDVIPSGPSLMDEISGKATDIANKTELLLNKLNLFLEPQRQQAFWDTVNAIRELAQSTKEMVTRVRIEVQKVAQESHKMLRHTDKLVVQVDSYVQQHSDDVTQLIDNTNQLVSSLQVTRKKLDDLLTQSSGVVHTVNKSMGEQGVGSTIVKVNKVLDKTSLILMQSEEELHITLEHLREAAENLEDFSVQIRENPSLLLRSPDVEERVIK